MFAAAQLSSHSPRPLQACKHPTSICLHGTHAGQGEAKRDGRAEPRVFLVGVGSLWQTDPRLSAGWRPFGPEWLTNPNNCPPSPPPPAPIPQAASASSSLFSLLLILEFAQFPGSGAEGRTGRERLAPPSRSEARRSLCKHLQARVYLTVNRSRAPL